MSHSVVDLFKGFKVLDLKDSDVVGKVSVV